MRIFNLLSLFVFLCLGCLTAQAQGNSYGYLVAGPGGISSSYGGSGTTLHIAGGGEGVFGNGAGLAGEVGYLFPTQQADAGLGIFSINGSYHFLKASEKVKPFLTGGYSGFFRGGYANGVNVGGGVTYWFKSRVGLRVEVRDNNLAEDGGVNFINVRFGITFR
jgi:hypothetical protein